MPFILRSFDFSTLTSGNNAILNSFIAGQEINNNSLLNTTLSKLLAPSNLNNNSISFNGLNITFNNDMFYLLQGRLIQIEQGTTFNISIPDNTNTYSYMLALSVDTTQLNTYTGTPGQSNYNNTNNQVEMVQLTTSGSNPQNEQASNNINNDTKGKTILGILNVNVTAGVITSINQTQIQSNITLSGNHNIRQVNKFSVVCGVQSSTSADLNSQANSDFYSLIRNNTQLCINPFFSIVPITVGQNTGFGLQVNNTAPTSQNINGFNFTLRNVKVKCFLNFAFQNNQAGTTLPFNAIVGVVVIRNGSILYTQHNFDYLVRNQNARQQNAEFEGQFITPIHLNILLNNNGDTTLQPGDIIAPTIIKNISPATTGTSVMYWITNHGVEVSGDVVWQ